MPESAQYLVVSTSAPDLDVARALADVLVGDHLAASVQIVGPIESHYWWREERCQAREYLCVAKTRAACYQRVAEVIRAHHPYETPEIVATPITHSTDDFLSWIARYTQPATQ